MIKQVVPEVEIGGITMAVLFGLLLGFTLVYHFSTKGRFIQHRSFVLLVVALMIALIESFLSRSGIIARVPHLLNISIPLIFLFGPFTYDYVLYQLGAKSSWKSKLLHYSPFVFYFIYSFNFFLQSEPFKHGIYMSNYHPEFSIEAIAPDFSTDPWQIQGWIVVEILSLHLLIYGLLSFYNIIKSSKANQKLQKQTKNWLIYVSGILTLASFIFFFSQGGVINGKVFFKSPFPHYSVDLFSTAAMYLFTIYILSKPEFFKLYKPKYKKSSLSHNYKTEKLKQLKSIIENDQLYLDLNFSLKTVSEKSGISTHHISQILNEEMQCTFHQLTNNYRIIEAKKRLKNIDDFLKMEQLAYDLGYKSKSTFFTAFKKATQITPSKYRKNLSN